MIRKHPAGKQRAAARQVGDLFHARRTFALTLAVALAGLPMVAAAQQPGMPYAQSAVPKLADPLTPVPYGTRQHFVPQHFDAQGQYVPPHYEAQAKPHFRGYYEKDMAKPTQQARGYAEPPAYAPTEQTWPEKREEGR